MGEGEGGGGQDEDLLGPPSPSSPPTEGRGDFFRCVFSIMDSLVSHWVIRSLSYWVNRSLAKECLSNIEVLYHVFFKGQ